MLIECFAQRLLNPYRGVMHTIRYAAAEAVTLDGAHWDIYVSNDALLEGLVVNRWTQITDIRYGSWSQAQGLKRGPIYPSEDFLRMEAMGAKVYQYITQVQPQLPFALQDRFECWLLDSAQQPLALLSSVLTEQAIERDYPIEWRAGYSAAADFFSPALQHLSDRAEPAADYLACYVNRCAGTTPVAQWFERQADGSGTGLCCIGLEDGLAGRSLSAQAFPTLLLAATGHDKAHAALIADFHAWQAPCLLSLSHLTHATRQQLEQQARQQALSVEKHFRLYPTIIDQNGIKATLVEALMQRSQSCAEHVKDTTLSTFYTELHPSPGGDRSF